MPSCVPAQPADRAAGNQPRSITGYVTGANEPRAASMCELRPKRRSRRCHEIDTNAPSALPSSRFLSHSQRGIPRESCLPGRMRCRVKAFLSQSHLRTWENSCPRRTRSPGRWSEPGPAGTQGTRGQAVLGRDIVRA